MNADSLTNQCDMLWNSKALVSISLLLIQLQASYLHSLSSYKVFLDKFMG